MSAVLLPRSVRGRGLLKLAGGVLGAAAAHAFVAAGGLEGTRGGTYYLIALAVPGAFALVGLIETCAGVPFEQIAAKWDVLKPWQRGVLGTLIALAALGMLFAVIAGLGYSGIL